MIRAVYTAKHRARRPKVCINVAYSIVTECWADIKSSPHIVEHHPSAYFD